MVRSTGAGLLGDIVRVGGVVLGVSVGAAWLIAATLEDAYLIAVNHGYATCAADASRSAQYELQALHAATVQPQFHCGARRQARPCADARAGTGHGSAADSPSWHGAQR